MLGALLTPCSGALAAYTTIVDNGPNTNRVNMLFLGDGYTATDIANGTYQNHIDEGINHFFHEGEDPFPRYEHFFNVHKIDVVSVESGADVPPLGISRNTALGARYYYDGTTERLLGINQAAAFVRVAQGLAGANWVPNIRMVTVNDTRYGGSGGTYAVYAGGNPSATEIALHETGHAFAGLADQYGGDGTYAGPEPSQPDITADPTGAKWAQWLGYNQPGIGTIGAYEGAGYFDHGLYRPSLDSKMRSLGQPFDAIGREQIILAIYRIVDPLDSFTDNSHLLVDPAALSADVIDPNVINLQWYVDNVLVAGATGETFALAANHVSAGLHTIHVRAYDPTDWVRVNRDLLEENVVWNVQVVPEPASVVLLMLGGVVGLAVTSRRSPA